MDSLQISIIIQFCSGFNRYGSNHFRRLSFGATNGGEMAQLLENSLNVSFNVGEKPLLFAIEHTF